VQQNTCAAEQNPVRSVNNWSEVTTSNLALLHECCAQFDVQQSVSQSVSQSLLLQPQATMYCGSCGRQPVSQQVLSQVL
jgi:hypothetical protein